MKTAFELEKADKTLTGCFIRIIGVKPNFATYVVIDTDASDNYPLYIQNKDLEKFAINILKALKSKAISK